MHYLSYKMNSPHGYLRRGITESRDVDWHVSGAPLPTNQQPFSYRPMSIFLQFLVKIRAIPVYFS